MEPEGQGQHQRIEPKTPWFVDLENTLFFLIGLACFVVGCDLIGVNPIHFMGDKLGDSFELVHGWVKDYGEDSSD
ncbi:MAG: hypothetical protein AAGD25_06615 [Cyanobacteria bacterium P01_F01_bin.150]